MLCKNILRNRCQYAIGHKSLALICVSVHPIQLLDMSQLRSTQDRNFLYHIYLRILQAIKDVNTELFFKTLKCSFGLLRHCICIYFFFLKFSLFILQIIISEKTISPNNLLFFIRRLLQIVPDGTPIILYCRRYALSILYAARFLR